MDTYIIKLVFNASFDCYAKYSLKLVFNASFDCYAKYILCSSTNFLSDTS